MVTRMTTPAFILPELFLLNGFKCNFVPAILNTVRNNFMRLYDSVKEMVTM